jgi:transcription antitermination factor NusG
VFEEYASWFALHVRMHDYHNVEKALHCKGYEVFAPTYEPPRVKARRQRRARVALFPGYMFCSLDPRQRTPVLTVPGVIGILGLGSTITPVPASEIESLRRTVDSGLPIESVRLLEPGEPVEVQSGPLAGVKGAVVYHKGKYRVVISVSALNDRAVAVEVDRSALVLLKDVPSTQLELLNASLLDPESFPGVDGSLVGGGPAESSVFGSYREPGSPVVQTVG